MTGSYVVDADAQQWPIEMRLLDTQMGFMHALQTYVYEMGRMAMEDVLDSLEYDQMRHVIETVEGHIQTWHQLRALATAALREHGSEDKVQSWDQTASMIEADMDTCLEALRRVMR